MLLRSEQHNKIMKQDDFLEDIEDFEDETFADEAFADDDDEAEGFDDEDEFDEDEEYQEIELTNVKTRTAVLTKNNLIALLGVQTFDQGGTLCRVDPREAKPSVQIYEKPEEALRWFRRSLRTSRLNGWQIVYDGLPLHG